MLDACLPLPDLLRSVNLLLLPDNLIETCASSLVRRKLKVLHRDLNVVQMWLDYHSFKNCCIRFLSDKNVMLEAFQHFHVTRESLGDLKVTLLWNSLNIIPKLLYNLEAAPQPPADIKGIPEKNKASCIPSSWAFGCDESVNYSFISQI